MRATSKRIARRVIRDVGWTASLYGLALTWMPGCLLGFVLVLAASVMWFRWEHRDASR